MWTNGSSSRCSVCGSRIGMEHCCPWWSPVLVSNENVHKRFRMVATSSLQVQTRSCYQLIMDSRSFHVLVESWDYKFSRYFCWVRCSVVVQSGSWSKLELGDKKELKEVNLSRQNLGCWFVPGEDMFVFKFIIQIRRPWDVIARAGNLLYLLSSTLMFSHQTPCLYLYSRNSSFLQAMTSGLPVYQGSQ